MKFKKEKLCECGCGKFIKKQSNRFILGHTNKGKTKENCSHIAKQAQKLRGRPSPRKGLTKETLPYLAHSKETKEKIREICMGHEVSVETKEKIRKSMLGKNTGKKPSKKTKRKISAACKGRKFSEEHKQRMSKAHIGMKFSAEHRKNISLGTTGKKSHCWKGGISFEPYSCEFTIQLKKLIRYRDNYKCQLCGCPEIECKRKLDVHHIDYNKKNCLPENLISLCCRCNSKVNFQRQYWTKHFQQKIKLIMKSKLKLKLVKGNKVATPV